MVVPEVASCSPLGASEDFDFFSTTFHASVRMRCTTEPGKFNCPLSECEMAPLEMIDYLKATAKVGRATLPSADLEGRPV